MKYATPVTIAVLTLAGTALGSDQTNYADALARVEAAQQALQAAQLELAAAQAEVASTQQITQSTQSAQSAAQPSADTSDTEQAVEATRSLDWNEGWEYSFSAGITGASGNNENFAGRLSLTGERLTESNETRIFSSYLYTNSEGQRSASRGELGIHHDWLLEGPWRYFAEALYEYDEFQAWQHRLSGAFGVGYEFINNDKTTLIGRVGLGGSYEAGKDADEKLVPEGVLGLDWTYQLSTNTKLAAGTTYYPSLDDLGEFRWNNRAGIEVIIDQETGMTMNAGIEHRHDSTPGIGIKPNDINYYMGVGWKF